MDNAYSRTHGSYRGFHKNSAYTNPLRAVISKETTYLIDQKVGCFKTSKHPLKNSIIHHLPGNQFPTLSSINYAWDSPNHRVAIEDKALMADERVISFFQNTSRIMERGSWAYSRYCDYKDTITPMLWRKNRIITHNM